MTEVDSSAIREHIDLLHTIAAPLESQGKLVIASFGENPIQTDPKSGKLGCPIIPKIAHFEIGDVDHAVDWIIRSSRDQHRNVYTSLAIMRPDLPPGKKGEEADIVAVLGVVADFDDAAAERWLERVPLPPDLVLETSRGRFQCFYLFDRPEPVERVKPIGRRLRDVCRSDHGSLDLSHVWRIPGCLNWPNAKKISQGRPAEPQLVRKGP
jgi:RepB DNA-primase from phage plasmid